MGRGSIPKAIRMTVFARDANTCQYCNNSFPITELTVDHLIPLALGGLDESTNYATACRPCNERKGCMPFAEFAASINLPVAALPIHGDPIIENSSLPAAIRIIRKLIYDRIRAGDLALTGKSAQKKLEKEYRRSLWKSEVGRQIESRAPRLPGQVRVALPEIDVIAKNCEEHALLLELSKSAKTRNLIGTLLTRDTDVAERLNSYRARCTDAALNKRIDQAIKRFNIAIGKAARVNTH